jgi:hypothetical protein
MATGMSSEAFRTGTRRARLRSGVACLSMLALVAGCGGIFGRIRSEGTPLPKELPRDFAERFEVKEVGEAMKPDATPAPSPRPVATPADAKAAAIRAAKAAKPAVSTPAPVAVARPAGAKAPLASDEARGFAYPDRGGRRAPFGVGEEHVFDIHFFGMVAATVRLDVLPWKEIGGRRVWHLRGHTRTSKVFGLFYTVDDTIESYFDLDGLFSHRFHMKLNESKQTRDSLELMDSEKGQLYWWDRWDHKTRGYRERKEFFPMPAFPQDSFSSLFYMRTLDFTPGARHEFPIVNHGKVLQGSATVVGRETIETGIGERKAVKLKLDAQFNGIAQKRGDSFLWVSDDADRLLLRMDARVKVGLITATLQSVRPASARGAP